MIKNQHVAL